MAGSEERGNGGIDPLFDDPPRRRWWLLTKALEGAPLQAALETALAADRFILEGAAGLADRPSEDEARDGFAPTAVQSRYRH
jgi:hypothetical protein